MSRNRWLSRHVLSFTASLRHWKDIIIIAIAMIEAPALHAINAFFGSVPDDEASWNNWARERSSPEPMLAPLGPGRSWLRASARPTPLAAKACMATIAWAARSLHCPRGATGRARLWGMAPVSCSRQTCCFQPDVRIHGEGDSRRLEHAHTSVASPHAARDFASGHRGEKTVRHVRAAPDYIVHVQCKF